MVGMGFAGWGLYRDRTAEGTNELGTNPLQVGAALQMAVLFQAVLFGLQWAKEWWGAVGLVILISVMVSPVPGTLVAMARMLTPPARKPGSMSSA